MLKDTKATNEKIGPINTEYDSVPKPIDTVEKETSSSKKSPVKV